MLSLFKENKLIEMTTRGFAVVHPDFCCKFPIPLIILCLRGIFTIIHRSGGEYWWIFNEARSGWIRINSLRMNSLLLNGNAKIHLLFLSLQFSLLVRESKFDVWCVQMHFGEESAIWDSYQLKCWYFHNENNNNLYWDDFFI